MLLIHSVVSVNQAWSGSPWLVKFKGEGKNLSCGVCVSVCSFWLISHYHSAPWTVTVHQNLTDHTDVFSLIVRL